MSRRSWVRDPRLVVLPVTGLALGLVAALFVSDVPVAPPAEAAPRILPPVDSMDDVPPRRTPAPPKEHVARPVRVIIPSIDVDAPVGPVGLNADGSMEVPEFGDAAWYTGGPRPGRPGPAVVVAHVDSYEGPDVFYRLSELKAGDRVIVRAADGQRRAWRVVSSEQTPKDELPTERIWNVTRQPVLRLVTCGGNFDEATGHYLDNVIVYAEPV